MWHIDLTQAWQMLVCALALPGVILTFRPSNTELFFYYSARLAQRIGGIRMNMKAVASFHYISWPFWLAGNVLIDRANGKKARRQLDAGVAAIKTAAYLSPLQIAGLACKNPPAPASRVQRLMWAEFDRMFEQVGK